MPKGVYHQDKKTSWQICQYKLFLYRKWKAITTKTLGPLQDVNWTFVSFNFNHPDPGHDIHLVSECDKHIDQCFLELVPVRQGIKQQDGKYTILGIIDGSTSAL